MTKRLLTLFNTYFFALLLLPLVVAFIPAQSSGQSLIPGDIIITEFMADPDTAADGTNEYIELYNRRAVAINIDGFVLLDDGSNKHIIDNGGTLNIPAESFITLAASSTPGFTPDYDYSSGGSFSLGNSGDEIILSDASGNEIARLNYISSQVSTGTSSELNDINNVDSNGQTTNTDYVDSQTAIGNSDNGSPGTAGETNITESPTLRFLTSESTSAEDSGSDVVTVLLQDPDGNEVSVDVVFQTSGSDASESDFDDSSPVTLTFGSGAADGAQMTAYTPTNDGSFESSEKAVFTLSNLSTSGSATITSPSTTTVTLTDDDAPDIVINEILYEPAGDADGDGSTDSSDDEFIEFVNNENSDIDISGWTVYDDAALDLRHTFPSGTVIPANGALVLFADDTASPVGGFGGAVVQSSNESATLSLNNGGDTITLQDAAGNTVVSETYDGNESDESITRDPDITGSFTGHSGATGSSSNFSPGTQINGTAFGSATYAIGIRGSEGWRMISSPTQSTTFNDLFSDLWTQGITGSDDPSGGGTQFGWTETGGGSFIAPGSMGATMTPGQGYIVYVFEDDELNTPGIQGGFPKTINTGNAENTGTVSVAVTSSDTDEPANGIDGNEGFNLLGNPFGTDISVTAVLDALDTATGSNTGPTDDPDFITSRNIAVWNPDLDSGNGDWEILGDGDRLAPFQAFFMRYVTAGVDQDIDFIRADLAANQGTEFFKQANKTRYEFNLSLEDGERTDSYIVEFSQKGNVELDQYDAFKLFSLNADAINLYSIASNHKLTKNALPERPEEIIEIPLAFDAPNRNKLTFRWDGIRELPQHWDVTLIDRTLGRELDLRREEEYTFTFQQAVQNKAFGKEKTLYKKTPAKNGDVRFVLRVNPGQIVNNGNTNLPSSNQLNPNYPNPFNPTTTISYSLTQETQVKISVWNIVGQKVATLVDGVVEAGTHTELWNASDMPSGIYIAQMEVGGNVYIRKMTLIK